MQELERQGRGQNFAKTSDHLCWSLLGPFVTQDLCAPGQQLRVQMCATGLWTHWVSDVLSVHKWLRHGYFKEFRAQKEPYSFLVPGLWLAASFLKYRPRDTASKACGQCRKSAPKPWDRVLECSQWPSAGWLRSLWHGWALILPVMMKRVTGAESTWNFPSPKFRESLKQLLELLLPLRQSEELWECCRRIIQFLFVCLLVVCSLGAQNNSLFCNELTVWTLLWQPRAFSCLMFILI